MGDSYIVKRLVLAWAVTALAATGAAVAVLGLLGGSLTGGGGHVMSQAEVSAALAAAPSATRPAARPSAQSATPSSESKLIRTAGGTVIATCQAGQITLRNWSPAQGFSVDDPESGPAGTVKVEFDRDEGEDVEVELGCQGNQPVTLPR